MPSVSTFSDKYALKLASGKFISLSATLSSAKATTAERQPVAKTIARSTDKYFFNFLLICASRYPFVTVNVNSDIAVEPSAFVTVTVTFVAIEDNGLRLPIVVRVILPFLSIEKFAVSSTL